MDNLEKVKQEIERLKRQLIRGACAAGIAMEMSCKEEAYNEILSFIDSLQDDSKVVKNDHFDELDKEIREYINAQKSDVFRDVAYHFANWQKQQDQETIELAEDHAMLAGMEKMKEQMTEKAISLDIDDCGIKVYEYCVEKLGLTSEDKIKAIIFKQ